MLDIRQTQSYANYLRRQGWLVKRIDGVNYFIRKIPLIGSVLKIQRPQKLNFNTIDKLSQKYGVFQIIIEPNLSADAVSKKDHELILSKGFKLSKSTYLPSKTLLIDLTKSRSKILAHFKKDARGAIRKGSEIKIKEYSTPNEIKIFREAWKASVKLKRFVPSAQQLINLRKSFPQKQSLFIASHNISGRVTGGALFTTSSHGKIKYITYYWQAFTNFEGRSTLSQYSLLWYGILWAKRHGYKLFDFEGIYDQRFPNKSWLGFTHFKKSFGGNEVAYPGCYISTFSRFCKTVSIRRFLGKTCGRNI